ncbi:MAG: hypothetical protein GYB53_18880 [Rhodobacteraceae bacterium]|nr:hypothetical protein [Paracoccaceae bacterium]MBR9822587.1 hypothetical protein [Paracoccaceae bacterium]
MDMVFIAFFGFLALIVALILGIAGWRVFFGGAKDLPNSGPGRRTRVHARAIRPTPGHRRPKG